LVRSLGARRRVAEAYSSSGLPASDSMSADARNPVIRLLARRIELLSKSACQLGAMRRTVTLAAFGASGEIAAVGTARPLDACSTNSKRPVPPGAETGHGYRGPTGSTARRLDERSSGSPGATGKGTSVTGSGCRDAGDSRHHQG